MDIFLLNPRYFKLDRKSSQASQLMQAIKQKLLEFLGDYSDDVLAEYIAVLVCNGKNQNQAKDDLEAFLGCQSGNFVAWLWEYLSENIPCSVASHMTDVIPTTSHDYNTTKDQKNSGPKVQQNHSAVSNSDMSKDGKRYVPAASSSKPMFPAGWKLSEEFERWSPGSGSPASMNADELQMHKRSETRDNGTDYDYDRNMRSNSCRVRCTSRVSVVDERCLHNEDQPEKMSVSGNILLTSQAPYSPHCVPVLRKLQPVMHDKPLYGVSSEDQDTEEKCFLRNSDVESRQVVRCRGNVWDRLGRPVEENTTPVNDCLHDVSTVKRKKLENNGGSDYRVSRIGVHDTGPNGSILGDSPQRNGSFGSGDYYTEQDKLKQKRHIGVTRTSDGLVSPSDNKVGLVRDTETGQMIQKLSLKSRLVQNLNADNSQYTRKDTPFSMSNSSKGDSKDFSCGARIEDQVHSLNSGLVASSEVPLSSSNSSGARLDSLRNAKHACADLKPVEIEVQDVKLRLQQIELEMSKLRSKQAHAEKDAGLDSSFSSGKENHSDEDIESRTVFVTNVHFAATKEALSSHFFKCGTVMKTVLLADHFTGQPKGSAYVVFSCKESADKAVAMSGTSFFSRALKIVHKTDMHAAGLAPLPSPAKSPSSWPSSCKRKSVFQQSPHLGSHLRWQRDPSANFKKTQPPQAGGSAMQAPSANADSTESTGAGCSKPTKCVQTKIGEKSYAAS